MSETFPVICNNEVTEFLQQQGWTVQTDGLALASLGQHLKVKVPEHPRAFLWSSAQPLLGELSKRAGLPPGLPPDWDKKNDIIIPISLQRPTSYDITYDAARALLLKHAQEKQRKEQHISGVLTGLGIAASGTGVYTHNKLVEFGGYGITLLGTLLLARSFLKTGDGIDLPFIPADQPPPFRFVTGVWPAPPEN